MGGHLTVEHQTYRMKEVEQPDHGLLLLTMGGAKRVGRAMRRELQQETRRGPVAISYSVSELPHADGEPLVLFAARNGEADEVFREEVERITGKLFHGVIISEATPANSDILIRKD